jgi:hypothetical protein
MTKKDAASTPRAGDISAGCTKIPREKTLTKNLKWMERDKKKLKKNVVANADECVFGFKNVDRSKRRYTQPH